MTIMLYMAAFLGFSVGAIHSILGERYILIRLFKRSGLPKIFGDTEFTIRTIRFAWHITTIAWWGFAALLFQLARGTLSQNSVARVVGMTFLTTAIITFAFSRARHLAWIVFLFIGCTALYMSVMSSA